MQIKKNNNSQGHNNIFLIEFQNDITQCYSIIFAISLLTSNSPSDECRKLPEIKNLLTTTQFPVPYSTRVTVQCDVGFSLKGGDVITCIKGDTYQTFHDQLPSCKESEHIRTMSKLKI